MLLIWVYFYVKSGETSSVLSNPINNCCFQANWIRRRLFWSFQFRPFQNSNTISSGLYFSISLLLFSFLAEMAPHDEAYRLQLSFFKWTTKKVKLRRAIVPYTNEAESWFLCSSVRQEAGLLFKHCECFFSFAFTLNMIKVRFVSFVSAFVLKVFEQSRKIIEKS